MVSQILNVLLFFQIFSWYIYLCANGWAIRYMWIASIPSLFFMKKINLCGPVISNPSLSLFIWAYSLLFFGLWASSNIFSWHEVYLQPIFYVGFYLFKTHSIHSQYWACFYLFISYIRGIIRYPILINMYFLTQQSSYSF